MNILNAKKKFKDVKVGEPLYLIDPATQEIIETQLRSSLVHPESKNKHVLVLEIYMPFRVKSITPTKLEAAKGFGTTTTQQVFVNKEDHLVILMTKIPTALSTERKYLAQWMGKRE
jgi:hypothetical protein